MLQSNQTMETYSDIRPSPLAGRWYPADPARLADSVDSYINAARLPVIEGEILGLVSPHAGHIYSGPVAGYGFAALRGLEPELVMILSPYHQYHSGALLTSGHQAYQTPLGNVPVDRETLETVDRSLQDNAGLSLDWIRRDGEHAVEILLPFFQRVLPQGFMILPLMIRRQDPALMEQLASILADLLSSRKALLAASSDLSHFQPADTARELDQTIIDGIISLDPGKLYQAQERGTGSACGLGALAALIWAVNKNGPARAYHLHYAHSGDVTGDNSSVVGYTSAIITRA